MTIRDQFIAATDRLRGLARREADQMPGHRPEDLLSVALAREAVAMNLNPERTRQMFSADLNEARRVSREAERHAAIAPQVIQMRKQGARMSLIASQAKISLRTARRILDEAGVA